MITLCHRYTDALHPSEDVRPEHPESSAYDGVQQQMQRDIMHKPYHISQSLGAQHSNPIADVSCLIFLPQESLGFVDELLPRQSRRRSSTVGSGILYLIQVRVDPTSVKRLLGLKLFMNLENSHEVFGHGDYEDDDDFDISVWAMEVIEVILDRAVWQPPKFLTLDRYLHHQYEVLNSGWTDFDEDGKPRADAPWLEEDRIAGNPNQKPTFNQVEGTITAAKKKQPKGWSSTNTSSIRERNLYIETDFMISKLLKQRRDQGRTLSIFCDERFGKLPLFMDEVPHLRSHFYPMLEREDVSKQEMYINFDVEIQDFTTLAECLEHKHHKRLADLNKRPKQICN